MTGPTTMNQIIHDAVRRDFARLETALSEVPDGDIGRARDLERAYANLRNELTRHHEGEDKWIWPALDKAGVDPELLATMESEHQSMSAALAETGAAMDTYAATGSVTGAMAARESAVRTQAVVNQHFSHEEDQLEPAMAPYLGSPEWKAAEKKLSRQPPNVAGPFFAWLTDGMSAEKRTALRSTVPPPVIAIMSKVFGRRYHRDIAPVWQVQA